MRHPTPIKSTSCLEADAAEVPQELAANREPLLITRKGEAKAVIQDWPRTSRRGRRSRF
jgi:hypothetical protein